MSGGVDSSVAAALLKRAGFNVEAVFMRLWSGRPLEAEKRARLVAKKLNIPFYTLNLEKEFKKKIIDYFLKEYRGGRTPNPCVVCNKEIKFGLLLEKSLALGADCVATGHYARVYAGLSSSWSDMLFLGNRESSAPATDARCVLGKKSPTQRFECVNQSFFASESFPKNSASDRYHTRLFRLLQARDKEKDQSYFLWQLNQKQLKHILFPVGDYTKDETRKLAKKFGLPTSAVPESQEICFIQGNVNDFLAKKIKSKPGPIIDFTACRTKIGRHRGLAFYTIGQRKGIKLSGGPHWVLDKDLKKNALIVTKKEKDLLARELIFRGANWISPKQSFRDATGQVGKVTKLPLRVRVKIRYGHKPASAILTAGRVVFDRPQRAVTPGQSVVFYRGRELIGGAFIFCSKNSKPRYSQPNNPKLTKISSS